MSSTTIKTLFSKKTVQQCLAESQQDFGFKRMLSTWDLTLLGVGVVMGTGIFVLTGRAAALHAGPAVVISLVLAALVAGLGALCYAEMASMLPISGSVYTYTYVTMGEMVAFLIGWDLILEYMVGAATVAVGWSAYATVLVERVTGWRIPWAWCHAAFQWDKASHTFVRTGAILNTPAVAIIALVGTILVRGVSASRKVNGKLVWAKLLTVLVFVIACSTFVRPAHWQPFIPTNTGVFGEYGFSGILQGASLLFFAYLGVDNLSTAALEARDPQRALPRAMMSTMAVCVVFYIGVALTLTGVIPYRELGVAHPLALAAEVTGYVWLELAVECTAVFGLTSVLLVQLFGQPRIFFAMANDGLLPPLWARVHSKFGTPHMATLSTCLVCATAAGLLPIDTLGELCSLGTLFAFALVSLGVLILRLRQPNIQRTFRVPGGAYLIPLISLATCAVLMASSRINAMIGVSVWLLLGLALYMGYGRHRSKLRVTQSVT